MPKQQSPLQLKGNIQLLVVDTDLRIRSALVRALNLIGYAAEGVSSGREALALLECRKRDLMIIDILLPDLNGVEVVKRARRRWPELQVIILTRQATLESAIAGVQLQVADYLIKPVNTRQILTAVSKALEERNRQLYRRHIMSLIADTAESLELIKPPHAPPALKRGKTPGNG